MEKNTFAYLTSLPEKVLPLMQNAKETIWKHPETGFREWDTQAFFLSEMEKLGYRDFVKAGDIPGFYTDIDTGLPGPTLVFMGEMDSIINFSHPYCDKETGAAHACGHNCQSASLLGTAACLKEEGALSGLCGKIRLMFVPAEELLELGFREELRKKGIIEFYGGKVELLRRGFFDDADLCLLMHTSDGKGTYGYSTGSNGCVVKEIAYRGKAAHAGGAPHDGINALYAANLGITAVNALRETFRDEDHIRFHPIVTSKPGAVNVIPDYVTLETYVRGGTLKAILEANKRINRALVASAAAIGAEITINDRTGYSPVVNDPNITELAISVMSSIVGEENVLAFGWDNGCTDMGDISCVFPTIQPHCSGSVGDGHGANYYVTDDHSALVLPAQYYLGMAAELLGNGGKKAKYIVEHKQTLYSSVAEFLKAVRAINRDIDGVAYTETGAELTF